MIRKNKIGKAARVVSHVGHNKRKYIFIGIFLVIIQMSWDIIANIVAAYIQPIIDSIAR